VVMLLVGCTQPATEPEPQQVSEPEEKPIVEPITTPQETQQKEPEPVETVPEVKEVSFELTEEEFEKASFKESSRVLITTNFNKMEVGEVKVIGLGIQNILDDTRMFRVKVNVQKVEEFFPGGASGLAITSDADKTMEWLTLETTEATLDQLENTVLPIVVEVKEDIGESLKTKSGHKVSYSIKVEESEEGEFWNEYSLGASELIIRIN